MANASSPHRTRVVVPNAGIPADPVSGNLPQGAHTLLTINNVSAEDPGSFISARVCKLGGMDDNTNVMIVIDGERIVFENFNNLRVLGLSTELNTFGVSIHEGTSGVKTMSIGFSSPLQFTQSLEIQVAIKEDGVRKMEATVMWSGGVTVQTMGPGDPNNSEPPFP